MRRRSGASLARSLFRAAAAAQLPTVAEVGHAARQAVIAHDGGETASRQPAAGTPSVAARKLPAVVFIGQLHSRLVVGRQQGKPAAASVDHVAQGVPRGEPRAQRVGVGIAKVRHRRHRERGKRGRGSAALAAAGGPHGQVCGRRRRFGIARPAGRVSSRTERRDGAPRHALRHRLRRAHAAWNGGPRQRKGKAIEQEQGNAFEHRSIAMKNRKGKEKGKEAPD